MKMAIQTFFHRRLCIMCTCTDSVCSFFLLTTYPCTHKSPQGYLGSLVPYCKSFKSSLLTISHQQNRTLSMNSLYYYPKAAHSLYYDFDLKVTGLQTWWHSLFFPSFPGQTSIKHVLYSLGALMLKQKAKLQLFLSAWFHVNAAQKHRRTITHTNMAALSGISHQGGKDSFQTLPCIANPHQGCSVGTLSLNLMSECKPAGDGKLWKSVRCYGNHVCVCTCEVNIALDIQRKHWKARLSVVCYSHYS